MKFHFKIVLILILLISIASCADIPSVPGGGMPDIGVAQEKMNSEFKLSVPKVGNTFKIGQEISLNIIVVSKNQVALERDHIARIFLSRNNSWVEVRDIMEYGDMVPDILIFNPYSGNPFNMGAIGVVPDLPDTGKAMWVRIFLVGSIYRDGHITDEKAASFVDVVLNP
jgi:hypothetical protein